MDPLNIFKKRLHIITGKGGVGRSTVTTTLAVAAAKKGKKVLVCEINSHKEQIAPLLGYDEVKDKIVKLNSHISVVNIKPETAMKEYGLMILKSKLLYKTIFENRYVKRFLSGFPGLSEMITLGKIRYHKTEKTETGRDKYDMIIIDAPATGHGISFLKFPITILSVLEKGALAKEQKKLYNLLTNKKETMIHIVTQPEELPVNESKELSEIVSKDLKMNLGYIFVNCVYNPLFSTQMCKNFHNLKRYKNGDINFEKLCNGAEFRINRYKLNSEYISQIKREIDLYPIFLPFIFTEKMDKNDISYLADKILNHFEG